MWPNQKLGNFGFVVLSLLFVVGDHMWPNNKIGIFSFGVLSLPLMSMVEEAYVRLKFLSFSH